MTVVDASNNSAVPATSEPALSDTIPALVPMSHRTGKITAPRRDRRRSWTDPDETGWSKPVWWRVLALFVVVGAFLAPRISELDRLVTPDEPIWLARSANFYEALSSGELGDTYQFAHPGVTVMWLADKLRTRADNEIIIKMATISGIGSIVRVCFFYFHKRYNILNLFRKTNYKMAKCDYIYLSISAFLLTLGITTCLILSVYFSIEMSDSTGDVTQQFIDKKVLPQLVAVFLLLILMMVIIGMHLKFSAHEDIIQRQTYIRGRRRTDSPDVILELMDTDDDDKCC